ncbi:MULTISPECIES: membrane protein insertion efficiency factor YidD [Parasutterella]|uniref:membrane protein insertion efficiency factor YidD n=2 Tax=Sutterellaceae TaxID=995019 RepID=UPI0006230AC3|nr:MULTISPECIES: membrane protein insertion efficiency factor YidD [Parasutterella]MBS6957185.1 membrane protein insertion efficiency factor YidD [Pseudomonadota bacterium]HAV38562.1 membrane protein insertion efficiency factor YidD [Sutterellaceae bacterium]HIV44638.1 membrane protein insertion efficiency factor YidD [Candidatus Parasutterella gallistercoris]
MIKNLCLFMIRGYQFLFSPWVGHNCRFLPTCSQYSYTSIQRFGAIRGVWLTFFRILRCNPFGGSGIDEVPDKFKWNCWCRDCSDQESQAYFFQSKLEKSNHGK